MNATEELKRLSHNEFQECFQRLYSCWQKCKVAQGGRFEGNIAYVVVLFCVSQKYSDSEQHFTATIYSLCTPYVTAKKSKFFYNTSVYFVQ